MASTRFIYIADVYCPWCYAFGPEMHRLAQENPGFSVEVHGGNLISNPEDLRVLARRDPGLVEFWTEVEQTSGRNLSGAIAAVQEGKSMRIYSPGADMILMALKKLAPGHQLEQLLLLEDMFYGQGLDLFADSSLRLIADRWKLDAAKLSANIKSPENHEATMQDLALTSELMGEINAYPTIFLVRGDQRDAVSRGYVAYETVVQRLKDVMRDLGIDVSNDKRCTSHKHCSFRSR